MKFQDSNSQVFISLLRAGLWEKEVRLQEYDSVDYEKIYRIAEEQSVTGLVAAGIEHIVDNKPRQADVFPFLSTVLTLEQRNTGMNGFIKALYLKLKEASINAILVKGQGIAQCYERPKWRACGDVDLLLDEENYNKSRIILAGTASNVSRETVHNRHLAMTIKGWEVELHGTLRSGLGSRIDKSIDEIQGICHKNRGIRIWNNDGEAIPLPAPDNDIIFVFTHILQHLFQGGIGLRQICDWCRLLWTYRDSLDRVLLERRIRSMKLLSEWRSFGELAVSFLGMPKEALPLYEEKSIWSRKAERVLSFILETGNFGHNRDSSYHNKYSFVIYKTISFLQTSWDSIRLLFVFPKDTTRVWWKMFYEGMGRAVNGIT